ncbi:MAG: HEAT repeat domain-containing protein [Planctomycetes bacterium]|nr:HEAT repeat domain-containing protein [Planctomycetota bacterium]
MNLTLAARAAHACFATVGACLALIPWALAAPQEPPRAQQPTSEQIDQWIEHARGGRPAVRPQAAQRLVRAGEPAAARLLALSGSTSLECAALGPDLIEAFGSFESPPLRAKLLLALRDPDFPWRPAAARGLAGKPKTAERALVLELLSDPLAAVRAAAIDALRALDAQDARELLAARLADEDDRVRRRAAALLCDWGDRTALAWLLEDLARGDAFFDRTTGQMARYEAWTFLKQRLEGTSRSLAFQPQWPPSDAQAVEARGALAQALFSAAKSPAIPQLARAAQPAIDEVLGLELRSCRKGEFFLRWNARDELWVGLGNAARLPLAPGTSEKLFAAADAAFRKLGAERFFGEPGCDLEDYLWRPPGAARAEVFRLSKGPQAVPGLRPAALQELARLLVASLPAETDASDPRTTELARRVREALIALGGELAG